MTPKRQPVEIVVRMWKRDGTTNLMSLGAAVENLRHNGWGEYGERAIENMLNDGQALETPHARFVVPR